MNDNSGTKAKRGKDISDPICEMVSLYLKADYENLKMKFVNPKAAPAKYTGDKM